MELASAALPRVEANSQDVRVGWSTRVSSEPMIYLLLLWEAKSIAIANPDVSAGFMGER